MNIHGFTKTTLLDYPGLVAATVFTGGCNFRCPFCHNADLVLNPDKFPREDDDEILDFLKKRHGILEGVCVTGGEPTLQPDLVAFIEKLKDMNYKVKLDTNGFNPVGLETLIDGGLLDYVAMDIKAGRTGYGHVIGIPGFNIDNICRSVDILSKNKIPYEFRTTAVKGLHDEEDFVDISDWLPSDCNYFIQSYKETTGIGNLYCDSFSKETLLHFLEIVKTNITNSTLRGVD